MSNRDKEDDFSAWKNLILSGLDRNEKTTEKLAEELGTLKSDVIGAIRAEIAALQVKAGFWGALGGLIPALGFFLLQLILRKGS